MGVEQSGNCDMIGEMYGHHDAWLPYLKSLLKYGESLRQEGIVEELIESIPEDKREYFERSRLLGDKVTIDDFCRAIQFGGLQSSDRIYTPYRTDDKLSYLLEDASGDIEIFSEVPAIREKRFERVITYTPEDVEPALRIMRTLLDPIALWNNYEFGF